MSAQNTDDQDVIVIQRCIILGGAGYPIVAGDLVDLHFGYDTLLVKYGDCTSIDIPYLELVDISIGGPGNIVTGGGFIGGGFGVEGAIEGIAVAVILNRLTSRSKIHTFITVLTHVGELHLHYGGMEPSALRIALSEVFTKLRRLDPAWMRTRLERLEVQRSQKLLGDDDFERLKLRLLVPPAQEKPMPRLETCARCHSIIDFPSEGCSKCKSIFGDGRAWKVGPI